jgi:hypothetical protein
LNFLEWLFVGGVNLILLGPPIAFGGLVGALWRRLHRRAAAVPPPSPASSRSRLLQTLGLITRVGLIYVAMWLGWGLYWQLDVGLPGWINFHVHRARLEAVVARAKTLPLDPKDHTGGGIVDGYQVSVMRSPEGMFTVSILTQDWNHAGSYGYVYAESEPKPTGDPYFPLELPGNLPALELRLDQNWWTAYNGLN